MRFLLRPANVFLLLTYSALSAIPFVPLLLGKPVERPWQVLGIEVFCWIAAWALCKRPAWFHWLLLPAFLALPTELYLLKYYGQGISTHHMGIIFETSPKEAMEFLGSTVWLMAAVMAGAIVWFAATLRIAQRTREFDWNDVSRWVTLAALALGVSVWAYGNEFGIAAEAPAKAVATAPASKPATVHLVNAHASASSTIDDDADDENDEEETSASASAKGSSSSAGNAASASVRPGTSVKPGTSVSTGAASLSVKPANRTGWKLPPLRHWAQLPFELDAFAHSWPFGLAARGIDFYDERKHLAELSKSSANFHFHAQQSSPGNEPQTVVLVIGESSRFDRWSLNGYERETNPLLKKEANLVSLSDVITSVSATRLSVPVIISRKTAMQSLKDGFAEKSFITAYKEAGFKTFWLSNQISFGQYDTPVSVFAKEADVIQFLNLGGFTNNSNFDQILFEPLHHALGDPAQKKLIVLHTLGSHWNYSQRYPKTFDQWQPSLWGVDKPAYTNIKIKPELNNSYDSSILYTDWFLSQVIGSLKQSQQLASLVYVSDHGQTLYDKSCRLAFHGHNTQYEFHIPAFVWTSDQYLERYPDKVSELRRHRTAKLSTENMFHTLLDLGDIHYPGEKLDWSFVNPAFKQHKRYVDSYGWTNYDNATLKGDCRELIDKGKPLKQEK